MPKFRVHCHETRSRWVTVEAPSREAVSIWYGNVDDVLFVFDGEGELSWGYDETEHLAATDTAPPKVLITATGEEVPVVDCESCGGPMTAAAFKSEYNNWFCGSCGP